MTNEEQKEVIAQDIVRAVNETKDIKSSNGWAMKTLKCSPDGIEGQDGNEGIALRIQHVEKWRST